MKICAGVAVSGVQPRTEKARRRPMIGMRMKPAKVSARNSFGSSQGCALASSRSSSIDEPWPNT